METWDIAIKLFDELVKLVGVTIWPAVVIVLLLSQKGSLAKLIEGLKPTKVEAFGTSWEFKQGLDTIEKLSPAVVTSTAEARAEADGGKPPEVDLEFNKKLAAALLEYKVEAKPRPADVVETAWQRVASILKEVLEKSGHLTAGSNLPAELIVKAAGFVDVISKPVAASIWQLFRTRNLVRLDQAFEPSYVDAERYAESADQIVYALMFGLESPVRGNT